MSFRYVFYAASLVMTVTLGACATTEPHYRTVEIEESAATPAAITPAAGTPSLPSVPMPAQVMKPHAEAQPASPVIATPAVADASTAPAAQQVAFNTSLSPAPISDCQANFEEKIAAALKAIEERKARI